MDHSVLIDAHRAAGARVREGAAPRVLTFGDVPSEYRAGVEGCALFDLTDRGRLDVSGADATGFLHRLLASDVKRLDAGRSQSSLLLSAKGKVLHAFELFRAADRLWLSVPNGDDASLVKALDTYLFAEKVTFALATSKHAPLALCGPRADDVVRAALGSLPEGERSWSEVPFQGASVVVARVPVAGAHGWWVDGGPAHAAALWTVLVSAGAQPAGLIAHDCLRVEAGAAEPGADVDENVYPQEARLERAFSLDKGCYIGQEVVAKIDTYGGLNKRLTALRVVHDDPIARGTRLWREDDGEWRDLGVTTSWAYSFVLDTGLVLAYVKRRHQDAGTVFRVGDGPATATVVESPVRSVATQ